MDETAIYLDARRNYTYSPKGAKRVKGSTCGSERTRLSTAFTGAADVTKLPVFTILPLKTELVFEKPELVEVESKTNSTFDSEMIIKYL